ncbi:MFS transporter [Leptolyngbya ohadii]|uniref:MFS transporter n=1 Tax=Leptolyngbya ohadii TaxID=1962290 RepID=UPI0019D4D3AF|nr:MFS transporter [Leptolyngbya ohadii]
MSSKISKADIRASLRASTLDGIFATLFSSITGGVLISNFLIELEATPFQIGMLASMPMLANLLQPLGAYCADRTNSRKRYSLWVYGISRLLWLPLAIVIIASSQFTDRLQPMIFATLVVMLVTHIMDAIGSASWLSWLATLVPRQLRGRYFGFRNSAFSLTGLVALPLLGLMVSRWAGGSIQGFGIMMIVAVIAGGISLVFQSRMTDIDPQVNWASATGHAEKAIISDRSAKPGDQEHSAISQTAESNCASASDTSQVQQIPNSTAYYGLFLVYFALWGFGISLSSPFFNLYLLDNLSLDLSWVTVYNGLGAGANLLMLLQWGRLADRIGNRSILLLDGLLVAVTPLFWLGTGADTRSLWLWFPLLHLLGGGTGAAIDLCINNLQFAIVPVQHQTKYFATTAAIGGIAGAMGALTGGWLAQSTDAGNITGVFALSSILRLGALLPLVWLQEPQRRSIREMLQQGFN